MATFSISITPSGPTTATLSGYFTGGSSTYGYARAVTVYLGNTYWNTFASPETSGSDNTFSGELLNLVPDTTYTWRAVLCSWAPGWEETGYTTSGTFHTPSSLTLSLTSTPTTIDAVLSGFEDVNYARTIRWTLIRQDTAEQLGPYSTTVPAHGTSSSFSFSGLASNKTYQCTCRIYRQSDGSLLSTITQSIQTRQGAQAYIFSNGAWHEATPYIYTNGSWQVATPNIYSSGQWK